MLYYNNKKIIKAYKGTSIINKMDDYVSGSGPTPIPDNYVIPFEDSNVKTLCVNNWGGNVVSGELTYGEAKAVTSLGSVFRGNRNITKFNELVYFTSLSTLDNGEFAGCTNLTDIVIPSNVTYIGDVPNAASRAPFSGCSNLSGLTILSGEETLEVHMFSFNGSYWMNSAHQSTPMIFPNRNITFSDGGFAYCDYLTTVYFQSITPPIGLADADIGNYRKLSTVYCPIGSYDAYYAVLNPKGKTVIEYDFDADPNNVLAREREWSGKTQSGTTSETKAVFQYITDGGEEPTPTDYSREYLTFVAEADNMSVGLTNAGSNVFQYSVDNGSTWNNVASNQSTTSVNSGQKIMFKANSPTVSTSSAIGTFKPSVSASVEGNVMSLIYGDNFIGQETMANRQFRNLFNSATNITSAEHLVLPSTTLTQYCYTYMFSGCTSLTVAPELPATTLGNRCYHSMFQGCTSLTTAPELPATMLRVYCYQSMFYGCSSLNSITCLATNIGEINCTQNWLYGVAANGTFVKAASMTSWPSGDSGIPNGWEVVDAT